jgi:hypothetical protein
MGYTTNFSGRLSISKPLTPEHLAYLMKFPKTRRMKRNALMTEKLPDPLRLAVGLPVGDSGGYYVGDPEYSNGGGKDIVDHNNPPFEQPGLWCQWTPTKDGTGVEWDGGEKFYDYVSWLKYLIKHFYQPWGYTLNGRITWQGEEHGDVGTIIVEDNMVTTVPGHHPAPSKGKRKKKKMDDQSFDDFLQDATLALNDLWMKAGGTEMTVEGLQAVNDTLTAFFADKRS